MTISKLPKYVLKLETTDSGTTAYYTGVAYYAEETSVTGDTRISYTLSPANASAASVSDGGEGEGSGEGGGNTGTNETTDPTQSAIGTGTITIYNRDTDIVITIVKVDADNTETKLQGAEFQILKYDAASAKYEPLNIAAPEEEPNSKLTTGSDGSLKFEGLLDGKYKIVEKKSPAGYYNLAGQDIFFTIDDGAVTWTDKDGNAITEDNKPSMVEYDDLTFTVGNKTGTTLPSTGGSGTLPYILSGLILIAMAGAILLLRKRRA